MKKSNWIILAALTVAAIFFLWLWYYLGFNVIDNPFDLVIAIVWWTVVLVAVFGIHFAEKKRQQRIRTTYLAHGKLYNIEAGLVGLHELEKGATLTDALQATLAQLKYSFYRKDLPQDETVEFEHIVRTENFDENDEEKWEGEIVDLQTKQTIPFRGKRELARLLTA
ncbi:MAG: hypothetical protein RR547_07790 [Raoultibacter sp.]